MTAGDIILEEKERRFDAALNKLRATVEAGAGVADAIFNACLVALENYRSDLYPHHRLSPQP
jgi:chaperonin GroEL (HSP60 family)